MTQCYQTFDAEAKQMTRLKKNTAPSPQGFILLTPFRKWLALGRNK